MKKIFIIGFIILGFVLITNNVSASNNHTSYEKLELSRGKLLDDYTSNELKSYYKKVDKSKFTGWNIENINNRVEAKFISETIFTYYNDGYTPIDYTYKMDETEVKKYSFSANGSISISGNGTGKGFKAGLDSSLKLSYSSDINTTKKETYEVKLKVDPGTQVNFYKEGTGRLTNGVGARYLFWIRTERGGFEVFEISSSSTKLEKIKI